MDELAAGGYPIEFRMKVLEAACKGYGRMWESQVNGTGHINRPEKLTRNRRRWEKLCGKTTWFKTRRNNKPPTMKIFQREKQEPLSLKA